MISPDQIKRAAAKAGFDLAGVASVRDDGCRELAAVREWCEAGHGGEMKYLEKRPETGELRRASLKNAVPWARSVVVCAMNYNPDAPYSTEVHDAQRGWISRYAQGRQDYHDSLLARLRQLEARIKNLAAQHSPEPQTWCSVDTDPAPGRGYAKYARLG